MRASFGRHFHRQEKANSFAHLRIWIGGRQCEGFLLCYLNLLCCFMCSVS